MSSSLRSHFIENKINMENLIFAKNIALSPINLDDDDSDQKYTYITEQNENDDNLKYDSNIIIIDTESEIMGAKDIDNMISTDE